jgi:hypothetical protein
MTALPFWRGAMQNAFHQLSHCNVSGALRPKSATQPPGRTRVVESGTLVINDLRVTVQRRRNAFAIAVEKNGHRRNESRPGHSTPRKRTLVVEGDGGIRWGEPSVTFLAHW